MSPKNPVYVFYSYSHKDERFRIELEKSLTMLKREGAIEDWSDRKIEAGANIDAEIERNLERAQVILLLVSRDFLHSDYCYGNEMKHALEKDTAATAKVIPIILRPCEWTRSPLGKLRAIPKDGFPIIRWRFRDEAWLDISREIRNAVTHLNASDSVIQVPTLTSAPIDPGDPGAPRRTVEAFPAHLVEGYLPNIDVQPVSVGRPNAEQDDTSVTLSLALNASDTRIAYTQREPGDVYSEPRVVAVQEAPSGQWWVQQWCLRSGKYEGVAAADYSDANMFAIYQLDIPRAAIWWPASGLLSVQYENGRYYPEPRSFGATAGSATLRGHSRRASAIAEYIAVCYVPNDQVNVETIETATDLYGQDLEDALSELASSGFLHRELQTSPETVRPDFTLWYFIDKSVLDMDMRACTQLIAKALCQESPLDGPMLTSRTEMLPQEINLTVLLMEAAGVLELAPNVENSKYVFDTVRANHKTLTISWE